MSNSDFIKSVLEILQLYDSFHRFIPVLFRNSDFFIKKVDDVMYINPVSQLGLTACPHCDSVSRHTSKGIRSINLTYFSFDFFKVVLVVNYHRFICNDCHHYFKEDIPFQFDNRKITIPNASIIADKFHYVRLIRTGMVNSRLNTCSSLKDRSLAKSIKKNLHLFDKYQKNLDNEKQWFDHHLKKYFTCQTYIEYIFDLEETEEFYKNYKIYQNFLKIVHEPHNSYKDILNEWLDDIFDTKNEYYLSTAKNIRKRWFMPIIRSLTYNAYYIRGQAKYKTCFNNGYIESMNNVVKLVKRNAHGFRYFDNLRKRIFLHLGCKYEFKFKKRKKGTAIAML